MTPLRSTEAAPAAELIPCFEPATRASLGGVPVTPPDEVADVIARARRAQRAWRQTSFRERKAVLRRALEIVLDEADELCEVICRDSGKTRENALNGEIWPVCEKLRWTIARGARHLRPERVRSGFLLHKRARLEFHPLGVIGAIIPWNYPLQNIANPVIPALMAGNAAVIKPSEWVAWSAERCASPFRRALAERGHDPALVSLVQGYAATGQALIRGGIDGLVFIGSVGNGRRVLAAAADKLVPVILELGGKDPFIVCDDADLDRALHAALTGTFINCGQNCVASERLLVFREVYEAMVQRAAEAVSAFRQGPPLAGATVDVGAMITPLQLEVVERLVKKAVEEGARVVCGGHRVREAEGDYYAPTVLADLTPEMEIMREEVFGPVMLLCPVDGEREAIEVANQTRFGLGSSVFTRDRARGRRIAAEIEAGMTGINDFGGLTYMAQDLTFGGVKDSGFGRINGREGLRACCNVKAVIEDRLPFGFPTKVYPVGDGDFELARATVRTVYGKGLRRRVAGVRELARALRGKGGR
ncbi:MAG: aldehyde dehydrogenase family protein [Myxococcales bacterium]|nr:aldehyde dehydrogenase family protein [Myxococcales bacterium]